ncbi:MAG: hypothetical protein GX612_02150 [Bacteroidales bacterium]|nr:hypothetical protein [Bacteroidales bacterium]
MNKLMVGAGAVAASVPAFAEGGDITSMVTAATTAISAAEVAVGTILVSGLVITIAMWSYGKIKQAIRKN